MKRSVPLFLCRVVQEEMKEEPPLEPALLANTDAHKICEDERQYTDYSYT